MAGSSASRPCSALSCTGRHPDIVCVTSTPLRRHLDILWAFSPISAECFQFSISIWAVYTYLLIVCELLYSLVTAWIDQWHYCLWPSLGCPHVLYTCMSQVGLSACMWHGLGCFFFFTRHSQHDFVIKMRRKLEDSPPARHPRFDTGGLLHTS